MKQKIFGAIGILITIICLWYALRGIHFADITDIIKGVNYWWTPGIVLSLIAAIFVRAWRWKIMLEPIQHVKISDAYSATMIGFMANNVLPLRLGEVVRAYALGKSSGVSKSLAFATIVVERAFDLMALLLFLALLNFQHDFSPSFQMLGYIALAACLFLVTLMVLATKRRPLAVRLIRLIFGWLPEGIRDRVFAIFDQFLDGFSVVSRSHHVLIVAAMSIFLWLLMALGAYFCILTFRLTIPYTASMVLTVVGALGVMIPSGPGFVGTFEVAAKYALMLFSVPDTTAVSFALLFHAIQFVAVTLLGFYHLFRAKISLFPKDDEKESEPQTA